MITLFEMFKEHIQGNRETISISITCQNSDPNYAIEDLCNDYQNAPLLQRKLSILLCQNRKTK